MVWCAFQVFLMFLLPSWFYFPPPDQMPTGPTATTSRAWRLIWKKTVSELLFSATGQNSKRVTPARLPVEFLKYRLAKKDKLKLKLFPRLKKSPRVSSFASG